MPEEYETIVIPVVPGMTTEYKRDRKHGMRLIVKIPKPTISIDDKLKNADTTQTDAVHDPE